MSAELEAVDPIKSASTWRKIPPQGSWSDRSTVIGRFPHQSLLFCRGRSALVDRPHGKLKFDKNFGRATRYACPSHEPGGHVAKESPEATGTNNLQGGSGTSHPAWVTISSTWRPPTRSPGTHLHADRGLLHCCPSFQPQSIAAL